MNQDIRSLPIGQRIADYEIEGILGQGSFGITYLAKDVMLHRKFAIKEYYPREFAVRDSTLTVKAAGSKEDRDTYAWGLERFLDEARILARFDDPNIIAARRFFEANGTAYLVMDYCDGKSLDAVVKESGPISNEKLNKLIPPLLAGLARVHSANFLHRDIKPSNIFIRNDGSPVLLDFGAARQEVVSHSKSVTSLATPGYGAVEQYSTHGKQGPWTDIYGMGATLYRIVTGEKPQDSPGRMLNDELIPASVKAKGRYSERTLNAIDSAMQVYPEKRPQTIEQWRGMFDFSSRSNTAELNFEQEPKPNNAPVRSETRREEPKFAPSPDLNKIENSSSKVAASSTPLPKTKAVNKKGVYVLVASIAAVVLVFAMWPQSSERQTSVRPTAVTSDSNKSFASASDTPKTIEQKAGGDEKSAGAKFTLFGKSLQVPRANVPEPMNEAETRWCIYEGIRIGLISTSSGKQNKVDPGVIRKFKAACNARQPDEVAKEQISKELSSSEIEKIKQMNSL